MDFGFILSHQNASLKLHSHRQLGRLPFRVEGESLFSFGSVSAPTGHVRWTLLTRPLVHRTEKPMKKISAVPDPWNLISEKSFFFFFFFFLFFFVFNACSETNKVPSATFGLRVCYITVLKDDIQRCHGCR